MTPNRPRALVVDDSAFMRSRIVRHLEAVDIDVVGEARDGEEGLELFRELRPDLVTMDLTMRGIDGLEATRLIRAVDPGATIVLFSIIDDEAMVEEALAAGVRVCIHKSRPRELQECLLKLCQAIRA